MQKHLVVAPASVLENWYREVSLWLPDAPVIKYTGTQKERAVMRERT